MTTHEIVNLPIGRLRANPKNVRTHAKRQVRQIADSIVQVGFLAPIIVDEAYCILAWQAFAKRDAVLEGTRKTFEEMAVSRASAKGRKAG